MTDLEPTLTRPPDIADLRGSSSPTIPTKLSSSETSPTAQRHSTTEQAASYRAQLQTHGFVVIPDLLRPHLLLAAQATCKYLVSRTRAGGFWPHVRTVPKQFPPWPKYESPDQALNIWGVQHLLHPDLQGLRDVFAEVYFADEILGIVRQLLVDPANAADTENGLCEDDLVMELFNLLVSPGRRVDFELVWHRDDVRPDVDESEETRQLNEKAPGGRQLHAQYNIALFEDESLIVVPGSHRRVRTETERNAGKYDVLPGSITVKLSPGDAVFYDSNILHRGAYKGVDEKEELGRMTLHGSVGLRGFGEERSRQVLQHGVGEWIDTPNAAFGNISDERKKRVSETMRRNLVEMGRGSGNVGYSLEG